MDHRDVGRYWDGNADTWTALSRAGYDTYRNYLNTPAFFEMLPDVAGLKGLDIGCGEGYNTRLLAARGARVTALDIAPKFVQYARAAEQSEASSIYYLIASAVQLPFPTATFDFATAFMSFMDIPEIESVTREVYRIVRAGGFLQFSISHPCFDTPHRRNLRNGEGITYAFEVGDYFRNQEGELYEFLFSAAPPVEVEDLAPYKIPRFTRTLSQWVNALIESGFALERVLEPRPTDETVAEHPNLQDAQVVSYFLHVRARKPG